MIHIKQFENFCINSCHKRIPETFFYQKYFFIYINFANINNFKFFKSLLFFRFLGLCRFLFFNFLCCNRNINCLRRFMFLNFRLNNYFFRRFIFNFRLLYIFNKRLRNFLLKDNILNRDNLLFFHRRFERNDLFFSRRFNFFLNKHNFLIRKHFRNFFNYIFFRNNIFMRVFNNYGRNVFNKNIGWQRFFFIRLRNRIFRLLKLNGGLCRINQNILKRIFINNILSRRNIFCNIRCSTLIKFFLFLCFFKRRFIFCL